MARIPLFVSAKTAFLSHTHESVEGFGTPLKVTDLCAIQSEDDANDWLVLSALVKGDSGDRIVKFERGPAPHFAGDAPRCSFKIISKIELPYPSEIAEHRNVSKLGDLVVSSKGFAIACKLSSKKEGNLDYFPVFKHGTELPSDRHVFLTDRWQILAEWPIASEPVTPRSNLVFSQPFNAGQMPRPRLILRPLNH